MVANPFINTKIRIGTNFAAVVALLRMNGIYVSNNVTEDFARFAIIIAGARVFFYYGRAPFDSSSNREIFLEDLQAGEVRKIKLEEATPIARPAAEKVKRKYITEKTPLIATDLVEARDRFGMLTFRDEHLSRVFILQGENTGEFVDFRNDAVKRFRGKIILKG